LIQAGNRKGAVSAVYVLLPAQPSCMAMGQIWFMTHTHLAW